MIVTQENISMEESFHKIKICILCIGTCICVLCSKLKKPNQSISFYVYVQFLHNKLNFPL